MNIERTKEIDLLPKLIEFTVNNQLGFEINFHESELYWQISLYGCAKGEDFFSGKRCCSLNQAIEYVLEDAQSFYDRIKANISA